MSDELPTPPDCSAGRAPMLQDISADYSGPRLNAAQLVFTGPTIKPQQQQGLADLAPEIPSEFSWRNKAGISAPRNQGACGSCWAFASTSALGDRYAIKHNIKAPVPSVIWTMSCGDLPPGASRAQQCRVGGNAENALEIFASKGVKLESCWPYSILARRGNRSVNCLDKLPKNCCYSCCGEGQTEAETYLQALPNSGVRLAVEDGKGGYDVEATVKAIQREIMTKGPVIGNYIVFKDFMKYWSDSAPWGGIYKPNSAGGNDGAHSVVITGWGEKNGQRFWEIRNSWGRQGDDGYCYMAFSDPKDDKNWCGIDVPTPNYIPGRYVGGALSFDIGENLPGKFDAWEGPEYIVGKINWKMVGGIGAILLFIAILYLILY